MLNQRAEQEKLKSRTRIGDLAGEFSSAPDVDQNQFSLPHKEAQEPSSAPVMLESLGFLADLQAGSSSSQANGGLTETVRKVFSNHTSK